jgi:hypothetical protein
MGVNVDKSRGNDTSVRVDLIGSTRGAGANEGNLAIGYFDIGIECRCTGAIDDSTIADNEVW